MVHGQPQHERYVFFLSFFLCSLSALSGPNPTFNLIVILPSIPSTPSIPPSLSPMLGHGTLVTVQVLIKKESKNK